jgi:hypothetical protein
MLRFGKTMQRSCWVFGGFLIACDLIRLHLPFDFNPLLTPPFFVSDAIFLTHSPLVCSSGTTVKMLDRPVSLSVQVPPSK